MLEHLTSDDATARPIRSAKGFTLIELLVVVVILGVLGAVVVFSVRGVTNDSRTAACLTEKRTIATAAEAYYAQKGSYPADLATLDSSGLLNDSPQIAATSYAINSANGKVTQGACPAP